MFDGYSTKGLCIVNTHSEKLEGETWREKIKCVCVRERERDKKGNDCINLKLS